MSNFHELKLSIINWAPRVVVFVLVVYLGFFLVSRLMKLLERHLGTRKINVTALGFFLSILSFALKILVVVIGLGILNVPMASISAVVGATTLSIGLALQGSLSNLAGGLLLVTTEPFQVGDYIVSDGFDGTVEEIALLTTHLRSVDGRRVIIPNSLISSQAIVNYSAFDRRRTDINLLISYDEDIEKVKTTLMEVANKMDRVIDAEVFLKSYADAGFEFVLRVWLPRASFLKDSYYLNELIKPALDRKNIKLAYPRMDVEFVGGNSEEIH